MESSSEASLASCPRRRTCRRCTLALEVDEAWPWPDAARSPESFDKSLRDAVFAHYVLRDLRTGELAGYVAICGVSSHSWDRNNSLLLDNLCTP